uniref:Uncharacterized protein n=1 Tax=Romanomermis culicivorax TaxID=13658 RepID=A0A915HME9_ROMCU
MLKVSTFFAISSALTVYCTADGEKNNVECLPPIMRLVIHYEKSEKVLGFSSPTVGDNRRRSNSSAVSTPNSTSLSTTLLPLSTTDFNTTSAIIGVNETALSKDKKVKKKKNYKKKIGTNGKDPKLKALNKNIAHMRKRMKKL